MVTQANLSPETLTIAIMGSTKVLPPFFGSTVFANTFSCVSIQKPEEMTIAYAIDSEEVEETEYIRYDAAEGLCILCSSNAEYHHYRYWLDNVPEWTFSHNFPIVFVCPSQQTHRSSMQKRPWSVMTLAWATTAQNAHDILHNAIAQYRFQRMCSFLPAPTLRVQSKN